MILIKINNYVLHGLVHFHYDSVDEDMYVFTSKVESDFFVSCDEGELVWIKKNQILNLPIWEGDKYFLDKLLNNEKNFEISLFYKNDILVEVK